MLTSESTKAIDAAILKFQGHVEGVKRDAQNPHFRSRYATLENVIDTARPVLQECGLTFMQFPGAVVDGCLEVTTRLAHAESGEWIAGTMHMPLGKRDPQGTGSAQTYAMRYSLMALLGLPPTDDDAEAATDRSAPAPVKRTVGFKPDGTRTSHSLKGDKAWEKLKADLDNEMLDVSTEAGLNTVREHFRERARKEQWNASYMFALSDVFEGYSESIRNGTHPFPGDLPGDVRIGGKTLSTLDAG